MPVTCNPAFFLHSYARRRHPALAAARLRQPSKLKSLAFHGHHPPSTLINLHVPNPSPLLCAFNFASYIHQPPTTFEVSSSRSTSIFSSLPFPHWQVMSSPFVREFEEQLRYTKDLLDRRMTSSTSTATPLKHDFTRQVEEVQVPKE